MGSNGKIVQYARKLGNVSREIEGLRNDQNDMLEKGGTPFTTVPMFTSLRMILVISKSFFLCSHKIKY